MLIAILVLLVINLLFTVIVLNAIISLSMWRTVISEELRRILIHVRQEDINNGPPHDKAFNSD